MMTPVKTTSLNENKFDNSYTISSCSSSLVSISLRDSLADDNNNESLYLNKKSFSFNDSNSIVKSNSDHFHDSMRKNIPNHNGKQLLRKQENFNKNQSRNQKPKKNCSKRSFDTNSNYTHEIPMINRRESFKSMESSEMSSNNLTYSDLDSNCNRNYSESKIHRRKLIKCILREDVDLMKNLLSNLDLLSIRDRHKNTLLHIACGFSRLKSVQALMKLCPKLIEQLDDKGHSPIEVAIKHGQIEIIKWWLNKSKRFSLDFQESYTKNLNQRSLIHFAAKHGENEILKVLLNEMCKHQVSLDQQDSNGNTAAHLAAKYNHLDCLQTLVEFNCDVTIVNKNGQTPCFMAEYYGNEECVHYLMIVETCINLSIKVVKMGRKLRESRSNNEILKAQMEEAIAINNDFINQRENVMNISLDLMQKQINELETKIFHQIKIIQSENQILKEKIDYLKSLNKIDRTNNGSNYSNHYINDHSNDKLKQLNNLENFQAKCVQIDALKDGLNECKNELINTNKNCCKVFKMDQKKLDNIKSRFDEIKVNIENVNDSNNKFESNAELMETKEHFEILRKMYQETTHKLMIFRNALKERQIENLSSNNENRLLKSKDSSNYSNSNSKFENSSSDNSSSDSLDKFKRVKPNKQIYFENKNISTNLAQIIELEEESGSEFKRACYNEENVQTWSTPSNSSNSSNHSNYKNIPNYNDHNLCYKSDATISDEEDVNGQLDFEDNLSDFDDDKQEIPDKHCNKIDSQTENYMKNHEKTKLNSNYLEEEESSDQLTYPTVIENSKYPKNDLNNRDQFKNQNQIISDCYTNKPQHYGNCQVIIEELEEHVEKEIEKIEHIHRETKLDYYYPQPGNKINSSNENNNNNYILYFSEDNNSKNLFENERNVQVELTDSKISGNKIRVKNRRRSSSAGRKILNNENS